MKVWIKYLDDIRTLLTVEIIYGYTNSILEQDNLGINPVRPALQSVGWSQDLCEQRAKVRVQGATRGGHIVEELIAGAPSLGALRGL